MTDTLVRTDFDFPGQTGVYRGKVRDVYSLNDNRLVIVATDRISAFDVVLPRGIPYKGQLLNQLAAGFLDDVEDIVPHWKEAVPHPQVTVGKRCEPIKIEMVIRGYLTGHAWRTYQSGKRVLCGVPLPEGMQENEAFPEPIITPATKAEEGHDEDISAEEILEQSLVSEADWKQLETYTRQLFQRGTERAAERGLILVDTKYEFGHDVEGRLTLIDEIHTPDSSRYFYAEGYQERQDRGERQKQLSKEFVREWLMSQGFRGRDGETVPEMTDELVHSVSERYIELYEAISGASFDRQSANSDPKAIDEAVTACLINLRSGAR